MQQNLVIDSTNVARLRHLQDEVTRAFLATAVVTGTLEDASGPVDPDVTDLPMVYAAGPTPAEGEYRALIPYTVPLVEGALYTFIVEAIAPDGSHRVFNVACKAIKG